MAFDSASLKEWVEGNHSRNADERFRARVRTEIDEKDYMLAAHKLLECRIPVGMRGLERMLNGDPAGISELYRAWRYVAFHFHVGQFRGDWIESQLEAGQIPTASMPVTKMEWACYGLAGAIVFDETDFAHWCGKRLLAYFTKPDIRPMDWNGTPIVPYVISLFLYWVMSKTESGGAALAESIRAECKAPYKSVLSGWNSRRFESSFCKLCDKYGGLSDHQIPFNGWPILILATKKVREMLGLSCPHHPLLDEPVCHIDGVQIDQSDPFFDEVNEAVVAIAPNDSVRWTW